MEMRSTTRTRTLCVRSGANMVVDQTQVAQCLVKIKEHVNGAFRWAMKKGPLSEENVCGIHLDIMDVTEEECTELYESIFQGLLGLFGLHALQCKGQDRVQAHLVLAKKRGPFDMKSSYWSKRL